MSDEVFLEDLGPVMGPEYAAIERKGQEMSESKHTPLPWREGFDDGSGCATQHAGAWITASSADGGVIIVVHGGQHAGYAVGVSGRTAEEAKANTALIVRAVNAHDALVEALRLCLDALDTIADGAGDVPDWNEGGEYYEAAHQARAALAKAKGE